MATTAIHCSGVEQDGASLQHTKAVRTMNLILTKRMFLAFAFLVGNAAPSMSIGQDPLHHARSPESSVSCRMTIVDTVYDTFIERGAKKETECTIVCIPIVDGIELDDIFTIALPLNIVKLYRSELYSGSLFVRISDAFLTENSVSMGGMAEFHVVPTPVEHLRRLQEAAIGTKTIAVVRVSTVDETPKDSASTLREMLFGDGVNFKTQFDACSFGLLRWEPAGLYDITLDQTINDFNGSEMDLITATQKHMKATMNIAAVSGLADKVMFCLPSGTGSWAASAAISHWRMQMNNDWCTSLSAAMHEAGHLLSLGHAGKDVYQYGDMTGYMGASYRNAVWPRKCFNGFDNWKLGWYKNRALRLNPIEDGPLIIHLAAFVDYKLASTDELVLVNLSDVLVLQYNRAKGFNGDTEEKRDMVTITERAGTGTTGLAGLAVGDAFEIADYEGSGMTLVVAVCSKDDSTATSPDVMTMSIAMDHSLCGSPANADTNTLSEFQRTSTRFQSATPSVPPTHKLNVPNEIKAAVSNSPSQATATILIDSEGSFLLLAMTFVTITIVVAAASTTTFQCWRQRPL
jgi:Gametolysin peptidase M11